MVDSARIVKLRRIVAVTYSDGTIEHVSPERLLEVMDLWRPLAIADIIMRTAWFKSLGWKGGPDEIACRLAQLYEEVIAELETKRKNRSRSNLESARKTHDADARRTRDDLIAAVAALRAVNTPERKVRSLAAARVGITRARADQILGPAKIKVTM